MQSVGQKVARQSHRPQLGFEFVIINNSVPNAWALPGGKIAINRGLLVELESEAELAAVLSHEVVHATARHGAKGLERGFLLQGGVIALAVGLKDHEHRDILLTGAQAGAFLITQKYSRLQELEADREGMSYMTEAGYDPQAAVKLQETFLRLSKEQKNCWIDNLFASHPPSQERIDSNKTTLTKFSEATYFVGAEIYAEKTAKLKENEAHYKALDKVKTKTIVQRALKAVPQEALFWNAQGELFAENGAYNEALRCYSKAIELNSHHWIPHTNRAKILSRMGRCNEAKEDLVKSIALLPTGDAHELLGQLFLQENNKKQAKYHLEIASHAHSDAGQRAKKTLSMHYFQTHSAREK